jgi:hypothetical protein
VPEAEPGHVKIMQKSSQMSSAPRVKKIRPVPGRVKRFSRPELAGAHDPVRTGHKVRVDLPPVSAMVGSSVLARNASTGLSGRSLAW